MFFIQPAGQPLPSVAHNTRVEHINGFGIRFGPVFLNLLFAKRFKVRDQFLFGTVGLIRHEGNAHATRCLNTFNRHIQNLSAPCVIRKIRAHGLPIVIPRLDHPCGAGKAQDQGFPSKAQNIIVIRSQARIWPAVSFPRPTD